MGDFPQLLNYSGYYLPDQIGSVLAQTVNDNQIIKKNKLDQYYNIPVSFDIETTSFYVGNEKHALMYEWTFGINGLCIIGRTWEQFFNMLDVISRKLGLSAEGTKMIIYVHNLAYEFQFIRMWLEWSKVFSLSQRKPVYATTLNGFEFRCSLILSGYNLKKLGDQLLTYKVSKMVGDLNYNLVRNSVTPLTAKEIGYCLNDVKVVMAYIQELIDKYGSITKLPLTKTGFVRRYCRNACYYEPNKSHKKSFKRFKYMQLMKELTITPEEYQQLKRAFQGGYTHASPFYSGKVLHYVSSDDFNSSYPAALLSERYPMSKGEIVTINNSEELEHNLKHYCCLFDIEFEGLEPLTYIDNYISQSRCWDTRNVQTNNGRVVRADRIRTTLTEQDFYIIRKTYKWTHMRIGTFRRYMRDYLPTDLVKAILDLYEKKTTLKGVEEMAAEYLNSKEMLNSVYGMMVMDVVQSLITYDNTQGWGEDLPNLADAVNEYNESKSRFTFYPWGVWCTAYARRNLWTGILNFGYDYIYSDTDSIKALNREKHVDYINQYNDRMRKKLETAMRYHDIDIARVEPATVKGVRKCLGLWDYEGTYYRFKTLGAKRYMVENTVPVCEFDKETGKKTNKAITIGRHALKTRKINITVAGINKGACVPYLNKTYGKKVFTAFSNNLAVPPDYTGKMTHTYIDYEQTGEITDYLGNTAAYHEKSSIHLEASEYGLSLAQEYIDFIKGVQYNFER